MHPTIKFTASFDYETKSTSYLDTVISVVNGIIHTDLYRKKTDRVQYLLPSSCHPSHIFNNIPYSLALRLVRICSTNETLNLRFKELETMLLSRNYNKNVISAAIERASLLDRREVLKKVTKTESKRVIMVLRYHPKLVSVSNIIKKHYTTMIKDPILKKIFPERPMLAFAQPPNLRNMLVRAKHPSKVNAPRIMVGMHKCNSCPVCELISTTKEFRSNVTDESHKMKGEFNCNTVGVIYLITCNKCSIQYVGQTSRKFRIRLKEHVNDIKNKKDTVCGLHFNSRGHSIDNLRAQIIEKVCPNNTHTLLEREKLWIQSLVTRLPHGLNSHD